MGVDQIDHLQNIRMAERYGEYVTAFKVVIFTIKPVFPRK